MKYNHGLCFIIIIIGCVIDLGIDMILDGHFFGGLFSVLGVFTATLILNRKTIS